VRVQLLSKLAGTALVAVLAFAAAGCGSESPQEKWAGSVCSELLDWSTQMKQLGNDAKSAIQSPTAGTIGQLQSDAQQAVDATTKLDSNLKDLGPAPGSNGQDANTIFTTYAKQVNQAITQLQSSATALSTSKNLTEAATALTAAAGQVSTFSTQTQNAVNAAKQTSDDLKKGFDNASSCKDLKKQTS
jgi:methyl-accepting chemotaxis protein